MALTSHSKCHFILRNIYRYEGLLTHIAFERKHQDSVISGSSVTTESIVRVDTWFELFGVFRKKMKSHDPRENDGRILEKPKSQMAASGHIAHTRLIITLPYVIWGDDLVGRYGEGGHLGFWSNNLTDVISDITTLNDLFIMLSKVFDIL